MSVAGIELFREAMSGCEGSYVLIGGSACDLLMEAQGVRFRATKDLDVIALLDKDDDRFASAFWSFVKEGGYEPWRSLNGEPHFYRFIKPKTPGFPHMIELFARHPDFKLLRDESIIAPLHFEEDVSSLSAILLDDDYYQFVLTGLTEVEGLCVLDAEHLIPLKMRAHIDLDAKHSSGQHVNDADRRKHRNDVFRLLTLVSTTARVPLTGKLAEDAKAFINTTHESNYRIDQLQLGFGLEEALDLLRTIYEL